MCVLVNEIEIDCGIFEMWIVGVSFWGDKESLNWSRKLHFFNYCMQNDPKFTVFSKKSEMDCRCVGLTNQLAVRFLYRKFELFRFAHSFFCFKPLKSARITPLSFLGKEAVTHHDSGKYKWELDYIESPQW